MIGIGGSGLSAIATVLLERGYRVSGSDRQESPQTRRLAESGARIDLATARRTLPGRTWWCALQRYPMTM